MRSHLFIRGKEKNPIKIEQNQNAMGTHKIHQYLLLTTDEGHWIEVVSFSHLKHVPLMRNITTLRSTRIMLL